MKKVFWFFLLLIIAFGALVLNDFLKQSPVTTEEIIRGDELEQAEIAKKIFIEIVEKK